MSLTTLQSALNPATPGAQDAFTQRMRQELGFIGAKRLEDGTYVGLQPLLFTLAICVGVTEQAAYQRRYCYEDASEAIGNYERMNSRDFTPSGYVATRP